MKTERLLQVTSALCVALGTILLGMGQRDMRMALLAIAGAILSVWLTDVVGLFRLNRLVASIIAIIASIFAFRHAFPPNPYDSIIAIAKLLAYLELILLFQKKSQRVYWQLLVLSLLQVVVATLLVQGAQFGLMMAIFMFVAILDLALLNLYTQSLKASGHLQESRGWKRSREMVDVSQSRIRVLVRRDLFRQVFRMGIATLFLTALMFFMMPRLGRTAWRGAFFSRPRSVGFNTRIQLGQLGNTITNPSQLLQVKLIDPKQPERAPMQREIYLHGVILNQYVDRYWSYQPSRSSVYPNSYYLRRYFRRRFHRHFHDPSFRLVYRGYRRSRYTGFYSFFPEIHYRNQERPPKVESVSKEIKLAPNNLIQDVIIEPFERCELFGIKPYTIKEDSFQMEYDAQSDRLLRDASVRHRRFHYQLYTTGISKQYQSDYYTAEREVDVYPLLQLPENIPTVIHTAEKWIEKANLSDRSPLRKAAYITRQLGNPEFFTYELNVRRNDFTIDPIEDFVKNNPKGHCEYFATALAMMLRSQGIPCRVVLGFKCNEYDRVGKFYRVRQLHAHTWVEAYLSAEEAGLEDPSEKEEQNGVWYRFDPTPVSSDATSEVSEFLMPFAQFMDWFDSVWASYVMEMDRTRQDTAIYQPILNWFKNVYSKVTDPEWWRGVWEKTKPMLNPRNWNTEKWISWRGGLIGIAVMLTMVVVFRGLRWFYRIVARRIRKIREEKQRRRRIEVEFYRRFLLVAARWGLSRKRGQTSREFAAMAGPQIAKTTKNHQLEPLPSFITEAYYQVRFGQSPLDKDRQEGIELAIGQLEAAVETA